MSNEKYDVIGRWSEKKLELLRQYLEAYTTIMQAKTKEWCKGFYYIDAFAGTGKPKAKGEERFVEGSPICALKIKNPFNEYWFIERSNWRIARLESLKRQFPNKIIHIEKGDCNKILREKIFPIFSYKSYKRAFLFLDPFGMQIDWEVIQEAAKQKTIEILLNLPVMAINRSLPKDPSQLTKGRIDYLNRFWGGSGWKGIIYVESRNLFGPITIRKKYDARALSEIYKKNKLNTVFPQVSFPLEMRNSKNSPLYCLFYAGHYETAKKIVEDVFKRSQKKSWV